MVIGQTADASIVLVPTGTIGVVHLATGAPARTVRSAEDGAASFFRQLYTDGGGTFHFDEVPVARISW